MRKIIWLLASCLMVLSLIIASCGPATVTEEEEEEEEVMTGEEEEEEEESTTPVETTDDTPQYGGTIYLAELRDVTNWANGLEFC